MDREALFEQFLACLQQADTPPAFLDREPEDLSPFDPYQMVGEWIALRHEVKQQGKQLQSAQMNLQKAMETIRTDRDRLHSLIEENQQQMADQYTNDLAAQTSKFDKEQERLLQDLLGVMDALDRACDHWQVIQEEEQSKIETGHSSVNSLQPHSKHQSGLKQWLRRWFGWLGLATEADTQQQTQAAAMLAGQATAMAEIVQSSQEGLELIRRTLLEVLHKRGVEPIEAQGQPFNSSHMYALGRQESHKVAENAVVQEVVRGYFWRDRVLREAQVIVAVRPK